MGTIITTQIYQVIDGEWQMGFLLYLVWAELALVLALAFLSTLLEILKGGISAQSVLNPQGKPQGNLPAEGIFIAGVFVLLPALFVLLAMVIVRFFWLSATYGDTYGYFSLLSFDRSLHRMFDSGQLLYLTFVFLEITEFFGRAHRRFARNEGAENLAKTYGKKSAFLLAILIGALAFAALFDAASPKRWGISIGIIYPLLFVSFLQLTGDIWENWKESRKKIPLAAKGTILLAILAVAAGFVEECRARGFAGSAKPSDELIELPVELDLSQARGLKVVREHKARVTWRRPSRFAERYTVVMTHLELSQTDKSSGPLAGEFILVFADSERRESATFSFFNPYAYPGDLYLGSANHFFREDLKVPAKIKLILSRGAASLAMPMHTLPQRLEPITIGSALDVQENDHPTLYYRGRAFKPSERYGRPELYVHLALKNTTDKPIAAYKVELIAIGNSGQELGKTDQPLACARCVGDALPLPSGAMASTTATIYLEKDTKEGDIREIRYGLKAYDQVQSNSRR